MTTSHFSGPLVVFGIHPTPAGAAGSPAQNAQAGPSAFYSGTALLDSRVGYQPGQDSSYPIKCFCEGAVTVLDATPSTIADNNIAASQTPTASVALTLVAATGAGITVGVSIVNAATRATVTGLLAIDSSAATLLSFGQDATMQAYDPSKMIARNLRITSAGNDSAATATVVGYDVYGYAMTETITLANAGIASGKKAFKYITSVTPAGTLSGSAVKVGTGDVYGLPLRADKFGAATIFWNSTLITASTGFVVPDATSPATATTGDVRGTYAVQSASDGTKTIQVVVRPSAVNLQANLTTALFGVAQV